jgi:hypothetical protein
MWKPESPRLELPDLEMTSGVFTKEQPAEGKLNHLNVIQQHREHNTLNHSTFNTQPLHKSYVEGLDVRPYAGRRAAADITAEQRRTWNEESVRRLSMAGEKDRRIYNRSKSVRLPTHQPQGRPGDAFAVSGLNTSLGRRLRDRDDRETTHKVSPDDPYLNTSHNIPY